VTTGVHDTTSFFNHSGPFQHRLEYSKICGSTPREIMSAGFSFVLTCYHLFTFVTLLMWLILFVTKFFSVLEANQAMKVQELNRQKTALTKCPLQCLHSFLLHICYQHRSTKFWSREGDSFQGRHPWHTTKEFYSYISLTVNRSNIDTGILCCLACIWKSMHLSFFYLPIAYNHSINFYVIN
jgi:hypothetical protein